MKLLGRDRELAVAEAAIDEVREGEPRVLGILGEAGIGKTALLAALTERARANGLKVLHGRGAEHERDVPFSVVIDALEDHVDAEAIEGLELGGGLPAERFRHHRAVRALLERLAERRPVALVLDDLHWADDASVELVLHLLRRPPRGRILLAFALRPIDPALRLIEAGRTAPGWSQLALEPLGHEAAIELLEVTVRDLQLRERIALEAAGNPLFLHELGAAAGRPGNELPRTLLATVALELAALDETSRTLIEGAAVAGERFDPELAVAAAGLDVPERALDALVAADLIRPSAGRVYSFRHPLVRRAVYDAAPPTWRLAAHERAAAVLERRGSRAESRAFHVARFARQGDEQAIALLGQAGAAAATTAPATAARWYGTALKLVKAADISRRAELLSEIAPALAAAGRLNESRDALVELIALAGPKPRLVAAAASLEAVTGRYASARARLLEALRHASAQDRSALALELANCGFFTGEIDEMRRWAAHAAEAAGDDGLLLADAEACGAVGALWQGESALAVRMLDRAGERLAREDDLTLATRVDAARQLAAAQVTLERFAQAAETAARGLAVARRTHQGQPLCPLLIHHAGALGNLLELDAAQREIDTAEEIARLQGIPHILGFVLWQRGVILDYRGRGDEAIRAGEELSDLARTLEPSALVTTGLCGAASFSAALDPELCLHTITRLAGPRLDGVLPAWWATMHLVLVRCALALGQTVEARATAALSQQRATALGLPASRVRAALAEAEVLLAEDEPQRAAALLLDAAAGGERAQALRDAAEARLLAGRALIAAGEADNAKHQLQRVVADAGQAHRLSGAAARGLRRLGTRAAPPRTRGGELTEREREIAQLVAQGRSNKEIGAALFLSEKTVEGALTRVYAKVGVRSRTQLARKLTAH